MSQERFFYFSIFEILFLIEMYLIYNCKFKVYREVVFFFLMVEIIVYL